MQQLHLYVRPFDAPHGRGDEIARHQRMAWQLRREERRARRQRALAGAWQLVSPARTAALRVRATLAPQAPAE